MQFSQVFNWANETNLPSYYDDKIKNIPPIPKIWTRVHYKPESDNFQNCFYGKNDQEKQFWPFLKSEKTVKQCERVHNASKNRINKKQPTSSSLILDLSLFGRGTSRARTMQLAMIVSKINTSNIVS